MKPIALALLALTLALAGAAAGAPGSHPTLAVSQHVARQSPPNWAKLITELRQKSGVIAPASAAASDDGGGRAARVVTSLSRLGRLPTG